MRNKLLFLFLLISVLSSAQTYRYIGIEDGLSNKRVYSLHQDNKGYMWFLTHEGIDRYDGKSFKHYSLSTISHEISSYAEMNKLNMDKSGTLWEVSKSGSIFKYNDIIDNFQLICNVNETTPIHFTYIDRNDDIWISSSRNLYLYKTSQKKLVKIFRVQQQTITNIVQAENNLYYIATNSEIYAAKLQNSTLIRVPQKGLDHYTVYASELYYNFQQKKLFIGSFQKGIYVYDRKQQKVILTSTDLNDVSINRIRAFKNRSILIATNGAGIYIMNIDNYKTEPFITADYDKLNGMNGNTILDLYIDNEERIWMANYPIGVTLLNNNFPIYDWHKHAIGNNNSLINNQVNAIIEDSQGDLWFATNDGVSLYNSKTKKWSHTLCSSLRRQNRNHIFVALCEISPGVIWVGGYASGIFQIEKNNMSVRSITPSSFGESKLQTDKYIRSIIKDSDGLIWSGGHYKLKCTNLKSKTLRKYHGISSINVIIEKDKNNLWIGTANGLFLLNKQSGHYKHIEMPKKNEYIYTLHQEKNGTLYIGTSSNGLLIYNHKKNKFGSYNINNSKLISNNIYTILSNNKGTLFCSTENGIVRFDIPTKEFQNWTKEQGLLPYLFNASSGTYRKNGNLLFGGVDGCVEFNEKIKLPQEYASKLVFSDFKIFYQSVSENKIETNLTQDIDDSKTIFLKYTQNIFSIKLSTINYDNPSDILYSWKLEGFYNEWSKPSRENVIRYTNLGSGEYKLSVRAISLENRRVIEEKSLSIVIMPPFWRSPWAFVIYIILLIMVTRIPLHYYNMQKEGKASNEKINFFINTAHDIRTPLSLIKAPLEELSEKENLSQEGQENLDIAIKNTNSLFKLITNLINFEKTEMYSSKLKVGEYELFTFLDEIINHFKVYAESNHIKLVYESNFRFLNVWFDKEKMESILKNLISNAIKYTPKDGEVHIYAFSNIDSWGIEISDTGIGIPESEQKKLFRLFFRGSNAINSKVTGSGIGLLLVRKLVSLHKGTISLKSKENEGSTFKINFPQGHKHFKKSQLEWDVEVEHVKQVEPTFTTEKSSKVLPPTITKKHIKLRQRILLVEDNDDLRSYLQRSLSESYYVYMASDGQEGWDIAQDMRPDLVISDIMMPNMRGDELCTNIKSDINTSHIPVILLTALDDKTNIIQGLKTGADDYITKPFDIAILKANIATILANREILKNRFATLDIKNNDEYINCASQLDQEFMIKVKSIIEKNIAKNDFTVDTLCSALNMSRSSFYNKLKVLTDQAPADFVRIIRLTRATELLKSKKYSISEVSDMTGFSDAKYFREVFKKHYKVSPTKYVQENS